MASFGFSAYAQTDELTWDKLLESGKSTSYQEFSGKTITSSAVYAGQASSGADKYIQLRTNNNNAGIVTTASGGKLKSVTITFNEATTDRSIDIYGDNTAYSSATELYGSSIKGTKLGTIAANDESKTLTVSGDYTFVGLRSTSGAIYIDKITIVWEGGGSTITVPTPSISGTTPFTESTEVTISGTPEGGKTYYTTDGSDPTSSSTFYSAPFTLTETTTVKAISYDKDNNASSVASKTFTKVTYTEAANIAAFNALEAGTKNVKLTLTNAQVLGAGNNNYAIKDASGSTLIYQSGLSYTKGQILNGTIVCERADYNGFTEIKSITDNTLTATDGTLTPKTATPEEVIAAGYFADSYKMEKVECKLDDGRYYITVGEKKIQIYDNFKYNYSITADGTYNLTGVLGAFKDVPYQFWLTEAPEAAQVITYPEAANIAAVKAMEDGTTVKLTLTDAVVNYANGTTDVFVEDATGAIDLYKLGDDFAFKAGQVLNGTLIAKYTLYKGMPELTFVKDVTVADEISAKSGDAPTPVEMTPAEAAKAENACKLITVKNITLVADGSNYYTDAEKTLHVFDKFKVNYTPNTESAMDYTGILVPFNDIFEICPTVAPTASEGGGGETPTTNTIYSWSADSEGIITEIGGKAVATDGESVGFSNKGYTTIRVNTKKANVATENIEITLDKPLEKGDVITVTGYKNKSEEGKLVSLFMQFEKGEPIFNDEETWVNIYDEGGIDIDNDGNTPNTNTYTVAEDAAGSKTIKLSRSKASTNLFITSFVITRGNPSGIQKVVKPVVENGIRYNLAGQRVDENYKGVVIMNGKKYVVK